MQKKTLILALVLYVVSAVASYGLFSVLGRDNKPTPLPEQEVSEEDSDVSLGDLLGIDPQAPRDQECPLNGALYTKVEREAWEKRRPLAVMIENSLDARPQAGLSSADIVFEIVAEGGITRYMGMFYCGVQAYDTTLAPVRSAREYFVDYASGFNLPLYVHVGGSNVPGPGTDALGRIREYGWVQNNDFDQFSIGYPTFVRDYNRIPGKDLAAEHTMVSSTEKLWEVGEEREWTNMSPERKIGRKVIESTDWKDGYEPWEFEDEAISGGSEALSVTHEFWSGYDNYKTTWEYDSATKRYLRNQGGSKDIDQNTDKQIAASNVVLILTTEKGPVDEKKHMIYKTQGTGDVLIFKNGQAVEAKWVKKKRESELSFVDAKGKPIEMARGLTWISVLDKSTPVEY